MYSGCAYTTDVNSRTSAKLRSAWIPPAVAQAPIEMTRSEARGPRGCARCRRRVVIDPSTIERSYGPGDRRPRRLQEVGDLDLAGDRQQLVLAVEQGQLAAVTGRELPDREPRQARGAHSWRTASEWLHPLPGEHRAVRAHERRSQLAVSALRDGALHVALHRHPDVRGRMPRSRSASAVNRIITSGPQTIATAPGSMRTRGSTVVTTPTVPRQSGRRAVDGHMDGDVVARPPRLDLLTKASSSAVRVPMTTSTAPKRSRWTMTWVITGRSGARPMPPATMTRSRPAAVSKSPIGTEGAAHTEAVADLQLHRARDTAPTSRIVCIDRPVRDRVRR